MSRGFAYRDDACSAEGARRLRRRIEDYWRERGHAVRVDLVDARPAAEAQAWRARVDVRSDLVDGWPRRA